MQLVIIRKVVLHHVTFFLQLLTIKNYTRYDIFWFDVEITELEFKKITSNIAYVMIPVSYVIYW